jgi:predicted acyl esterase
LESWLTLFPLQKFFDKYLKGIDNDWEKTPRVRWSTLQYGDREAKENIELPDFPVPKTDYKTLYLGSNGNLSETLDSSPGTCTHDSESSTSISKFKYTFDKPSRLIGLPKAVLYVSCSALDDMTVFVQLRKLDKDGKVLSHLQFPFSRAPVNSIDEMADADRVSLTLHDGSMGILRASQRKIDASKSIHPQYPFHPHNEVQKITPGEVVKLEIGIWAIGTDYDAGESIQVDILGQYPGFTEVAAFSKPRPDYEKNKGDHVVHFGNEHPSCIILPFVDV